MASSDYGPMRAQAALTIEQLLRSELSARRDFQFASGQVSRLKHKRRSSGYEGDISNDATFVVCKAWHRFFADHVDHTESANACFQPATLIIAASFTGMQFIGPNKLVYASVLVSQLGMIGHLEASLDRHIVSSILAKLPSFLSDFDKSERAKLVAQLSGVNAHTPPQFNDQQVAVPLDSGFIPAS